MSTMGEVPESSVTYEQLADLEREFDDVEAEISTQQPGLKPRRGRQLTRLDLPAEQSASR